MAQVGGHEGLVLQCRGGSEKVSVDERASCSSGQKPRQESADL